MTGYVWKKKGAVRGEPYPYRYEAYEDGTWNLKATGEARTEKDAIDALRRRGVDPQHVGYYDPRRRNPFVRGSARPAAPAKFWHSSSAGSIREHNHRFYADGPGGVHLGSFGTLAEARGALGLRGNPAKGRPFPADLEGMSPHALEDMARALEATLTPGQMAAARQAADRAAAKIGYPAAATYWKLLIRAMRHYARRTSRPAFKVKRPSLGYDPYRNPASGGKLDYAAILASALQAADHAPWERPSGIGRVYVVIDREHRRGIAAAAKKLGVRYLPKAYGTSDGVLYVGYDNASGRELARGAAMAAVLKAAGIGAYRDEVSD